MYTDDQNAQVVISLLKKYGIKKIVVSPGTTNVPISRSVQIDPWFEVYSVVDERSAAYFATGLAYESGEPVVISCTGATASRNYLPGLTEAYYRQLPVIALTSQHHTSDFGNLVPQITDRTISQNDIKKLAVNLTVVKDNEDLERCVISVNKALIAATTHGGGPVHINLHVNNFSFTTSVLPEVRKIEYFNNEDLIAKSEILGNELNGKKICIFVGSHRKFDKASEEALEEFARKYDAAVLVDHTSSYKGKNSILIAQIGDLMQSTNRPDLVIDLGMITGEYAVGWLMGIETWRISEDGEIHDRLHNQVRLFDCLERTFFDSFSHGSSKDKTNYYEQLAKEVKKINIPDLPLSNTLVSYELSRRLPRKSNLHLGILNSLRNMNFFSLDKSINTSSNVGGFGIDGALSTLVGQSMFDRDKLTFGLIGDLAAFYDMNALGIRHITKNLRIVLINNNGGVEFRLNTGLESQWSSETDEFISARGHNGSMRAWAEEMNFHYMSAVTKEELLEKIDSFCEPNIESFDRPVLFEVFTEIPDEQKGIELIHSANGPVQTVTLQDTGVATESKAELRVRGKIKSRLKRIAPESVKRIYREIRKND